MVVVAAAFLTMLVAFQTKPPGGITSKPYFDGKNHHRPGVSILALTNPSAFDRYVMMRTIAFNTSVAIIFLVVSGLPISRWILRIMLILVSLTALAFFFVVTRPLAVEPL